MGVGKDGEGGEGRGPVVCPPGQRIGLAIGCSLPVDDVAGVGRLLGPLPIVPSASLLSVPNPHLCSSSLVFSCAPSDSNLFVL